MLTETSMGCSCLVIPVGLMTEFTDVQAVTAISLLTIIFNMSLTVKQLIFRNAKICKNVHLKINEIQQRYENHTHYNVLEFISMQNSEKIHQRPASGNHFSLQRKVFLRSLTNYSNLIYLKNKCHFTSSPEFLSLLTPFCDHILRICCCAIYKTYYLVFRYISKGAACFYVSVIGLLTQKVICPWKHKNYHTESDPKPIQSSTASNQKHLL